MIVVTAIKTNEAWELYTGSSFIGTLSIHTDLSAAHSTILGMVEDAGLGTFHSLRLRIFS